MCGPYKKSSFKVLEGGSRVAQDSSWRSCLPTLLQPLLNITSCHALGTLDVAFPRLWCHLDYSPQVSSAGNCFIVWFAFREKLTRAHLRLVHQ